MDKQPRSRESMIDYNVANPLFSADFRKYDRILPQTVKLFQKHVINMSSDKKKELFHHIADAVINDSVFSFPYHFPHLLPPNWKSLFPRDEAEAIKGLVSVFFQPEVFSQISKPNQEYFLRHTYRNSLEQGTFFLLVDNILPRYLIPIEEGGLEALPTTSINPLSCYLAERIFDDLPTLFEKIQHDQSRLNSVAVLGYLYGKFDDPQIKQEFVSRLARISGPAVSHTRYVEELLKCNPEGSDTPELAFLKAQWWNTQQGEQRLVSLENNSTESFKRALAKNSAERLANYEQEEATQSAQKWSQNASQHKLLNSVFLKYGVPESDLVGAVISKTALNKIMLLLQDFSSFASEREIQTLDDDLLRKLALGLSKILIQEESIQGKLWTALSTRSSSHLVLLTQMLMSISVSLERHYPDATPNRIKDRLNLLKNIVSQKLSTFHDIIPKYDEEPDPDKPVRTITSAEIDKKMIEAKKRLQNWSGEELGLLSTTNPDLIEEFERIDEIVRLRSKKLNVFKQGASISFKEKSPWVRRNIDGFILAIALQLSALAILDSFLISAQLPQFNETAKEHFINPAILIVMMLGALAGFASANALRIRKIKPELYNKEMSDELEKEIEKALEQNKKEISDTLSKAIAFLGVFCLAALGIGFVGPKVFNLFNAIGVSAGHSENGANIFRSGAGDTRPGNQESEPSHDDFRFISMSGPTTPESKFSIGQICIVPVDPNESGCSQEVMPSAPIDLKSRVRLLFSSERYHAALEDAKKAGNLIHINVDKDDPDYAVPFGMEPQSILIEYPEEAVTANWNPVGSLTVKGKANQIAVVFAPISNEMQQRQKDALNHASRQSAIAPTEFDNESEDKAQILQAFFKPVVNDRKLNLPIETALKDGFYQLLNMGKKYGPSRFSPSGTNSDVLYQMLKNEQFLICNEITWSEYVALNYAGYRNLFLAQGYATTQMNGADGDSASRHQLIIYRDEESGELKIFDWTLPEKLRKEMGLPNIPLQSDKNQQPEKPQPQPEMPKPDQPKPAPTEAPKPQPNYDAVMAVISAILLGKAYKHGKRVFLPKLRAPEKILNAREKEKTLPETSSLAVEQYLGLYKICAECVLSNDTSSILPALEKLLEQTQQSSARSESAEQLELALQSSNSVQSWIERDTNLIFGRPETADLLLETLTKYISMIANSTNHDQSQKKQLIDTFSIIRDAYREYISARPQ